MLRGLFSGGLVVAFVAGSSALAAPAEARHGEGDREHRRRGDAPSPMIFVHGRLGSGQQFEAQALRFASNDFPEDHIELFEHDSLT